MKQNNQTHIFIDQSEKFTRKKKYKKIRNVLHVCISSNGFALLLLLLLLTLLSPWQSKFYGFFYVFFLFNFCLFHHFWLLHLFSVFSTQTYLKKYWGNYMAAPGQRMNELKQKKRRACEGGISRHFLLKYKKSDDWKKEGRRF